MKKVLLCIYSLRNGGAERVITNLANYLSDAGFDVCILTIGRADCTYELSPRIRIIELGFEVRMVGMVKSIISLFHRLLSIYKTFLVLKPDLCISFMTETNIMSLIVGRIAGVPVIVSERTNPDKHRISNIYSFLRKITYKDAKAIIVQTNGVCQYYRKTFGFRSLVVIPNPIKIDQFNISHCTKKKIILSVGRLSVEKGHLWLINAFAESDAVKLGWRLKIIGTGPLKACLQERVAKLSLTQHVHFEGRALNVYDHLKDAGLFVLPSSYEGFPNALMEALAVGVPCLSSDCDFGPSDLIKHGKNGLLVKNGCVVDLKEKINILLNDDSMRSSFQMEGPISIKKFDYAVIMDKWQFIVNKIIKKQND